MQNRQKRARDSERVQKSEAGEEFLKKGSCLFPRYQNQPINQITFQKWSLNHDCKTSPKFAKKVLMLTKLYTPIRITNNTLNPNPIQSSSSPYKTHQAQSPKLTKPGQNPHPKYPVNPIIKYRSNNK